MAKDTAITSASAEATVVAPLSLTKVADLNFGRIASQPKVGTVTINANNSGCTTTGTIIHQGACQYAEFAGMGTGRMTVRIQLPTSITLTGPGGATMQVNTFTLGAVPELTYIRGSRLNSLYDIVSNTGIFAFRVGGKLTVRANQAAGVYSGTFAVTAIYQ